MSRERAKILQMIADGTISPEEGEKLLSRLDPGATEGIADMQAETADGKSGPLKYLRAVVDQDRGAICQVTDGHFPAFQIVGKFIEC